MVFNDRLRAARMHRGITQQQMANQLNVALRTYQQYEQGKTYPSYESLVIIADFLYLSLDWLLGRDDYLEYQEEVSARYADVPETNLPRRPKSR